MGAIHFSIDIKLAELLANQLQISTFVETGTFHGDSIELVRPYFRQIHTCELSPELHQSACRRFEGISGIHCHLGPSEESLKKISEQFQGSPVLYWLDAHWCAAENTAGEESQCPLLKELDAIASLHADSVVWIDDARYFISPPPKPLKTDGWPSCDQVLRKLFKLSGDYHSLSFYNDTILLFPKKIDNQIRDFLYENSVDWLKLANDAKTFSQNLSSKSSKRWNLIRRVFRFKKINFG